MSLYSEEKIKTAMSGRNWKGRNKKARLLGNHPLFFAIRFSFDLRRSGREKRFSIFFFLLLSFIQYEDERLIACPNVGSDKVIIMIYSEKQQKYHHGG